MTNTVSDACRVCVCVCVCVVPSPFLGELPVCQTFITKTVLFNDDMIVFSFIPCRKRLPL